jgi:hypothetical protein
MYIYIYQEFGKERILLRNHKIKTQDWKLKNKPKDWNPFLSSNEILKKQQLNYLAEQGYIKKELLKKSYPRPRSSF